MEENVEREEGELVKRLLEQVKLGGEQEHVIKVPTQAVVVRNWRRCILVKVITDGRVAEETFSMTMRAAWRVHQNTKIEERKEREFLVEFMCERDLSKVLDGSWHFRGDMVAMKRVYNKQEAEETEVDTIDLWVQAHGFPMGLILPNAIPDIMRAVGTPISDPQVIYNNGVKVYKIKLMVSLKKPVLHTLCLENDIIGKYKVYLVYDKVKKICLYCGLIGHVKEQCAERRMYLRMKEAGKFKDVPELWNMPEINFKPWIIDQTKVPVIGSSTENVLDSTGRGGENSEEEFDGGRGTKRVVGDMTSSHNMQSQLMVYGGSMEDDQDIQPLNRKRAREAIPNSPPPSQ
ncbi:hypothetical protein LUZ63_013542 [Rhynchospora breviuscula]|uniref:DUF4283 domain-containing protein n=1 Tax=Rhynchospora breviuscula TaxID=2022672 RepID=A0A9Q0C8R6_9POAL|nr:hypothetical protein LUZ63_013542 [Rhynchospora breviuscula]